MSLLKKCDPQFFSRKSSISNSVDLSSVFIRIWAGTDGLLDVGRFQKNAHAATNFLAFLEKTTPDHRLHGP